MAVKQEPLLCVSWRLKKHWKSIVAVIIIDIAVVFVIVILFVIVPEISFMIAIIFGTVIDIATFKVIAFLGFDAIYIAIVIVIAIFIDTI